jgi:TRAP-type uncharacterized transport system substrate-binding protein
MVAWWPPGAAGSGTRFTVERLLGIAGLHPRLIDADQSQGAQMLAAGQVDAYITLTGFPLLRCSTICCRTDPSG